MSSWKFVLACIFVCFLYVERGDALSCFVCNSHNDTRCLDNPPPDLKQICSLNFKKPILCRKVKQVIDFEVNGLPPDSRIIRSCGWYNESLKNHCYQRSGFGGRQEVCACDSDNCNTANSLIQPKLAILAFFLIAKIFH